MNSKPTLLPRLSILPKTKGTLSSSSSSTLEAVTSGGEANPKRRCVSSACMPCRKRKSKCDSVQPSCNACTTVYNTQCYYDIDADHRRKGALKRDIAQLKGEIGPRSAILDAIKAGSEADVDDIVQLIRSNPDESWESIAESVQKLKLNVNGRPGPSAYLEGELANFSTKASRNKTGNARFYGHTSNLSLLEDEGVPAIPVGGAENPATWTSVTSDTELVQHLLDVYFSWSHPFYMLFSEEVFLHGLHDRKTKYCTPLLVNALLAVACHFSDRSEARSDPSDPTSLGLHFFAEADRLLQEDKRPCLTTVQALALMSIGQPMNSNDSSGWLYLCQMLGMAVELGLHLSHSTQASSDITPSEIEARRVTFWGCYNLQMVWSVCGGRVSFLPRTAIRLDKPILNNFVEAKLWRPYGHRGHLGDYENTGLEQPGLRYTILVQHSLLCEVLDDIIHMFYAPRDRITSRRLLHHYEKLKSWYMALPESLAIKHNGPTLPQIICLHTYYHNCILHLFRPFLRVSFVQTAKPPRQICTEEANKISELLTLYTQTYGFQRFIFVHSHCAVTAAIIHLVNLSGSTLSATDFNKTELYLADAIRALVAMEQSFPLVDRYIKAVLMLISKWCSVIPKKVKEAIDDIKSDPAASAPPKQSEHSSDITYNMNRQPKSDSIMPERKPSAPELLKMAPHPREGSGVMFGPQNSHHQQLFWSPFPGPDGVPLELPVDSRNPHMDITSMLDSGINGDWPQLNKDGFTVSEDDSKSLWGVWENGL